MSKKNQKVNKTEEKELAFYVLNAAFTRGRVEMWNIFNNGYVRERTEEEVKKYLENPKDYIYEDYMDHSKDKTGYEAIREKIDHIIMYEEWSRCEYEIYVNGFGDEEGTKVDCYYQAHANIDLITDMCIRYFQDK